MIYEAEFASGLLPIVRQEVENGIAGSGHVIGSHREDSLQFTYDGHHSRLLQLRTVIAIYGVLRFDIPRPKALLGHENFNRLCDIIEKITKHDQYETLYLSAAGSESSVMMRIKRELNARLGLHIAEEDGDLLLRMRRTPDTKQGWDVLIRLTARPLATRNWRVCNYEGALNASVASAMIHMSNPTQEDTFLNIASGSGTIMIERALMPARKIVGCDISKQAIECANKNQEAVDCIELTHLHSDAMQMPFVSGSFDKLVADLPFGQLVGSHQENEWLYPAILHEAARVAKQGARFIVITHEVNLMNDILTIQTTWKLHKTYKITLSGLHPRIYVLERL